MEVANETTHGDRGSIILAANSITFVVCKILTCFALSTRDKFKRHILLCGHLFTTSVLSTWPTVVLRFGALNSGNRRHVWSLTETQRSSLLKWALAGSAPGILSLALPTLAIVVYLVQGRTIRPSRTYLVFLWPLWGTCLLQLCLTIAAL